MKRLQAKILFNDQDHCLVYTDTPFNTVELKGLSPSFKGDIPSHYYAMIKDDVENLTLIERDEDPLLFVAYLYQGITGSYFRATEAEVIDLGNNFQKQDELSSEPIEFDINIDYEPSTLFWLQALREEANESE